MKNFLFIIFLVLCKLHFLSAKEEPSTPPIKIRTEVDKTRLSTTDELTFTITVSYVPNLQYQLPEMGGSIEGMRILNYGSEGPKKEDDRLILKKWYKLQADISGSYVLPPIEMTYTSPDPSQKKVTIKTSEIFIEAVAPTAKPNAAKDIRDIKTIVLSQEPFLPLWFIILFIFIIIFVGIFFYLKTKRKKIVPSEPPLPPYDKALKNLKDLENKVHENKIFHFSLSEIIRIYVEEEFHFPVTGMTFEEIYKNPQLKNHFEKSLKEDFFHLLKETDLIKYTDSLFGPEKNLELLTMAIQFVQKTAPIQNQKELLEEEHEEGQVL